MPSQPSEIIIPSTLPAFQTRRILILNIKAEFGVVFTDGNDRVRFNPATYPNDDWGLDGNLSTTMVFDQPQNWFAAYTPGLLSIRLYSQGTLFYTSNVAAEFNGVISDIPFDQVQVFDPGDSNVNMDDIHFGATPAPGAIVILTGFLLSRGKSRKRNV